MYNVSSKSVGTVTIVVVVFALYSSTLDLKLYNDFEVKVQTVNINLRVFSSISGEPFRYYRSLGDQKYWDKFTYVY